MKVIREIDVELDMAEIGFRLARGNSSEQINFFNSFARGFNSFTDGDKDGLQLLWMGDALTYEAKKFIAKMNQYINEQPECTPKP